MPKSGTGILVSLNVEFLDIHDVKISPMVFVVAKLLSCYRSQTSISIPKIKILIMITELLVSQYCMPIL